MGITSSESRGLKQEHDLQQPQLLMWKWPLSRGTQEGHVLCMSPKELLTYHWVDTEHLSLSLGFLSCVFSSQIGDRQTGV